jgi:hypothetical protein
MSDYLAGKADIVKSTEKQEKKEAPAKSAPVKTEAPKTEKQRQNPLRKLLRLNPLL